MQVLGTVKARGGQDLADAPVKALDPAVRLGPARGNEAVLDIVSMTRLIERVSAGGLALAGGGEAVGKLLAVVGQKPCDLEWGFIQQPVEKARGGARRLTGQPLQVYPAAGPVDGHEQIPALRFIQHLWQVLHIHMHVARRIVFRTSFSSVAVGCPVPQR